MTTPIVPQQKPTMHIHASRQLVQYQAMSFQIEKDLSAGTQCGLCKRLVRVATGECNFVAARSTLNLPFPKYSTLKQERNFPISVGQSVYMQQRPVAGHALELLAASSALSTSRGRKAKDLE